MTTVSWPTAKRLRAAFDREHYSPNDEGHSMTDPSPLLRLVSPAIQALRWLFGWLQRPKHRLVFIEQPGSGWASLNEPVGGIQLHVLLHVTNESDTKGLKMSRRQIRLTGWRFLFRKDPWQDCMMVDVDGIRSLSFVVDPSLPPGATTVMSILHHHRGKQPNPKQPIKFRLRVTDQHKQRHFTRLTVPPRQQTTQI